MVGIGTIVNTVAVIVAGIIGLFGGKLLSERFQESLQTTCGISVIFLSIAGAMEAMLSITKENTLKSGQGMFIVICLVLGTLIGEIINFEKIFEKFGEWLKKKSKSENDNSFVNGFLTASYTICIGAMSIIGPMEDALTGDWSILAAKSILDFIIVIVLTGTLGKGCIFSAIPMLILQGLMTALAVVIEPIMTDLALFNLSLIGNILIFCVGINLVFEKSKKIRVANMVPALILAVAYALIVK